jgi:hypothetical protein
VIKLIDCVWQAHTADRPLDVLAAGSAMELRDKMKDDFAAQESAARR